MNRKIVCLAVALALGVVAPMSSAHEGATGLVKDRMDLMKEMKGAVKKMAPIIKGKAAYDAATVQAAARVLERDAGQHLLEHFPKGSLQKPTDAKPIIWQEWERFSGLANKLQSSAAALGHTQDLRASRAAFQKVAKTCKSCHDRYRAEDDD